MTLPTVTDRKTETAIAPAAPIAFSWNGLPQYAARLIRAAMQRLGFSPCHYIPFTRHLTLRESASTHVNTLFVRDIPSVQQRLSQADAFTIRGWRV